MSFVHGHLKANANTRVSVAVFIDSYKSFLTTNDEYCVLSDKKIMGVLRKMGFVIFRSNSIYYIEKTEFIKMYNRCTKDYNFLVINNNNVKDDDLNLMYGCIKTPNIK